MSRQYNNYGRDQINVENIQGNLVVHKQERHRNQQILLKAVRDEVENRLASSLHNAVFLNLGKEAQLDQVKRPWDSEIKIGTKAAEAIPDDKTITQVFESTPIKGKLLILGKPGSGKTTTLLDLAKDLVKEAEDNANYPIPVLLNLSSWRDEKQLIRNWMVTELKSKYGVSPKLAQEWVAQRVLLPLLDGLDEVAPERQEKCVQQINTFLAEESFQRYAVVCSRIAEYENYKTLLQLNGAIYLKELRGQQIQDYLTRVERVDLVRYLSQNAALLEFVRTPLLLSMMVLAYPHASTAQWLQLQASEDALQHLLDAYVERMLHRELKNRAYGRQKAPTAQRTRWWLVWLAQQMEKSSQIEFLIDQMQPRMLLERQKWKYQLRDGLITGLLFGSIAMLLNPILLPFTLFIPLFISSSNSQLKIEPVEVLRWSWRRLINRVLHEGLIDGFHSGIWFVGSAGCEKFLLPFFIIGTVLGLAYGSLAGFLAWQYAGGIGGQIVGLLVGIIAGIIGGIIGTVLAMLSMMLLFGLIFGLIRGTLRLITGLWSGLIGEPVESVEMKTIPNQGIKHSAINFLRAGFVFGLFFGLIGGLIFGLFFGLIGGLTFGLRTGLILGLIGGWTYGGQACIQHFSLRLTLYQATCIPWNYARFLDYCTECLFLQRVGGRYRFIHKVLQDHFARMPIDQ